MIILAEKIGLEESVITQLKVIYENKENIISALSDMCMNKGFHILKGKSPMTALAVILKLAVDVKDKYDKAGIDEKYITTL